MDRVHVILVCAAAMGSAIAGGIFYAFSSFVMRALAGIAPGDGVAAMNSINRVVVTPSFMVVFAGTALLCVALLAGAWLSGWGVRSAWVWVACGVYLIAGFGLTMAVHQPMNLRLAGLSPSDALAYWPHYLKTWTAWNHVRAAASLLAAALFVVALLGPASNR